MSTMEAEYIALSTTMHDLIPLRTLVDEIKELMNADVQPCQTFSKMFKDNNGALILAMMPRMTPQSKHTSKIISSRNTCAKEKFIS